MPKPPSPRGRRATVLVLALGFLALAGSLLGRYVHAVGLPGSSASGVVVALGDSLTEGTGYTDHPWPEVLARRLRARRANAPTVVNAGIGGNRLLRGGMGPSALERFDRDVLARPGVRWVIVLEGINDLGFPGLVEPSAPPVTAAELIEAYRRLIVRAHAAALKIYGGTLLPFEGTTSPGYFSAEKEAVRQSVNAWIRTSGSFDAVIDFDAALRDPRSPARLLPAYDAGDHLHLNAAGHQAMGQTVDLRLFDEPAPGGHR